MKLKKEKVLKHLARYTLLALLINGAMVCFAQESKPSPGETPFAREYSPGAFADLDKQVQRQRRGWEGFKQPLATLFNAERKRLDGDFQTELLKYIDTDVEKHYWVSLFLTEPGYLHGNQPLYPLSLFIKQRALTLLNGKSDQESLGHTVKLSASAAVVSERIGLRTLANVYKSEAERLLAKDSGLRASFPAMSEEDRKLYDSIESRTSRRQRFVHPQ